MSKLKKRAEFRFAVIADLLVLPPDAGGLRQRFELLSRKPWRDPASGQPMRLSQRTIERWYYLARKTENPVEAFVIPNFEA